MASTILQTHLLASHCLRFGILFLFLLSMRNRHLYNASVKRMEVGQGFNFFFEILLLSDPKLYFVGDLLDMKFLNMIYFSSFKHVFN